MLLEGGGGGGEGLGAVVEICWNRGKKTGCGTATSSAKSLLPENQLQLS